MKLFVTGGTGFIGRPVVKRLESEGNELLVLSRQPKERISFLDNQHTVTFLQGDISDIPGWIDKVERFQPEATIHMAWEGLPDYGSKTSIKNLISGLNLLTELARLGCKRVICTGSCWEYGQQIGELKEDTVIKPFNAFSAAKNALHWLGRNIAEETNMDFTWTRLFYVYGPRQRKTSLIPHIIDCIRKGKKPEIKTPLAGNDFIHVGDVASAISDILKSCKQSTVYNIGSGQSTSVQEILEIVCDIYGLKHKLKNSPDLNSELPADFWADISRINEDTGWEPKIGIKDGIANVITLINKGR